MKLPPIAEPSRYAGLFVVDFGDSVAVGYTAEEIGVLVREESYRDVAVYRIHRVDEVGRFELAGVRPADLGEQEAMLFASGEANGASRDFGTLRRSATRRPLPCPVRAELIDLPDCHPPHVVCLLYARHASTMVSTWLSEVGYQGGELVIGGGEALALRRSAPADPVAAVALPHQGAHRSRTKEEILGAVKNPLQR